MASGERVVRGGSFADSDQQARATARQKADPSTAQDNIGFRCVGMPSGSQNRSTLMTVTPTANPATKNAKIAQQQDKSADQLLASLSTATTVATSPDCGIQILGLVLFCPNPVTPTVMPTVSEEETVEPTIVSTAETHEFISTPQTVEPTLSEEPPTKVQPIPTDVSNEPSTPIEQPTEPPTDVPPPPTEPPTDVPPPPTDVPPPPPEPPTDVPPPPADTPIP